MKTFFTTLILNLLIILPSWAQKNEKNYHFEIEIDPIAYALRGYSFHGIFVKNKFRTDIGVFGIQQPEFFSGNKNFKINTKGIGIKANYLLDKQETWFAGIDAGYSNNKITHLESGIIQKQNILSAGIHLGYRWFMLKKIQNPVNKLFVTPWCSVDYNIPINQVKFSEAEYQQKSITFFPTIHIGYKF